MARKGIASPIETENWPALRLAANELLPNSDLLAALSIQPEMFQAGLAQSKVALPARLDVTFDAASFPPDPTVDSQTDIPAMADKWKL